MSWQTSFESETVKAPVNGCSVEINDPSCIHVSQCDCTEGKLAALHHNTLRSRQEKPLTQHTNALGSGHTLRPQCFRSHSSYSFTCCYRSHPAMVSSSLRPVHINQHRWLMSVLMPPPQLRVSARLTGCLLFSPCLTWCRSPSSLSGGFSVVLLSSN